MSWINVVIGWVIEYIFKVMGFYEGIVFFGFFGCLYFYLDVLVVVYGIGVFKFLYVFIGVC